MDRGLPHERSGGAAAGRAPADHDADPRLRQRRPLLGGPPAVERDDRRGADRLPRRRPIRVRQGRVRAVLCAEQAHRRGHLRHAWL